jgi:uncharacterized coiled-coil protein SlyX
MSQLRHLHSATCSDLFRVFRGMATHPPLHAAFCYETDGNLCRDPRMKPDQPPDDAPRVVRFIPSESWIENFDKQCTEPLLKRARRYATLRAQDLGWEQPSAGPHDPDEVVDNIVRDTLAGVLRWDPDVRDFDQHLFDAVRKRITRYARRISEYPHESLDAIDHTGRSPVMAAVEMQLRLDGPGDVLDTRVRIAETVACLRKLARRKPLVLRLLTAFERRATEQEDVMREANMTLAEYKTARRQLARFVERLPSHLKPRGHHVAKGA